MAQLEAYTSRPQTELLDSEDMRHTTPRGPTRSSDRKHYPTSWPWYPELAKYDTTAPITTTQHSYAADDNRNFILVRQHSAPLRGLSLDDLLDILAGVFDQLISGEEA